MAAALDVEPIEKYISAIKFSLLSPEQIRKMAVVRIVVADTYDDDGYPIDGGLVDPHMGVIDPGLRCKTCGGSIRTCPGHFGCIELVRPVVHPEFAPFLYLLLRATCSACRRILLPDDEIAELSKLPLEQRLERLAAVAKKVKERVKEEEEAEALSEEEGEARQSEGGARKEREAKKRICPHCRAEQVELSFEKPTSFYIGERTVFPNEIRDELARISNGDLALFGFDPGARPEWAVLTVLQVPPVTVRPSITLESGERSEDDLTHKLVDIIRINQRLDANITAGAPQLIIEDLWELLQYHITTYFNNESPNIPPARHRSGRPLKTLAQRLKGKEGRFRMNLSGKRVNFSARTVITPDGTLGIGDVGIPEYVANELTVPIHVTDWNIEQCKQLVARAVPPRAVYVISPDGRRRAVTDANRAEILTALSFGWVVERNMQDGDIVLFNRYPSLHRMSIMAHRVKILPGKSFRLAPAVTTPYNADFDGDEMNIHVPQREEARAEAELLMSTSAQVISPRHGHAIIKPTEDHITGLCLLTRAGIVLSEDEVADALAACGIYGMPEKRGKGWEGKDVFSQLLPRDLDLEIKSGLCREARCSRERCPDEGYVIIRKGRLICGIINGRVLSELIERIASVSTTRAAQFIDRAARLATWAITTIGFTDSLASYDVKSEKIEAIVEKAEKEVNALIMQYQNGTLELLPGRTARESLEDRIMLTLSGARDAAAKVLEAELTIRNPMVLMAKSGARGSILNIVQIAGLLSQQAVRGHRPHRGFRRRVLAHFKPGDIGARAHGYVASNFVRGLNPIEFFFHAAGGRESIVTKAIRTARSGYMQRRFIHALQDLVVDSDLSTRDESGALVQTLYGGDGVDPMRIIRIGEVIAAIDRDELAIAEG